MIETLIRRKVKLGVFELLMARSFSSTVSLRQLWDKALSDQPILEQFAIDTYYVLQTISLFTKQYETIGSKSFFKKSLTSTSREEPHLLMGSQIRVGVS